jgi:type II secretory pathway pseudopilin PulG
MRRHRRGTEGFSLIEMAVSLAILVAVLASLGLVLQRGMGLFRTRSATSDIETRAARGLDRMVRELRAAASGTVTDVTTPLGAPKFWAASLDYRPALDWTDGALELGPARRLELALAPGEVKNGLDDNGDGLADEGVVQLVIDPGGPGEQSTVLATRVRAELGGEQLNGLDDNGNGMVDEAGLCFDQEQGLLTIRLSVEGVGPSGEAIVRTFEDALVLRN